MVRTDYQYGLNPVVVKALTNLHYRYTDETPKMWCSRIRVPFKKLLEYNPTFFSKNEFIHMTERSYRDGNCKRSFHIYCTVCDSLVFICENTEKCADKHLNECIAKIEERRITYVRSVLRKRKSKKGLSSIEIDEIYHNIYHRYKKIYECYYYRASDEFKRKIAYRFSNSAKVIQQAWRTYKLGPETWAKRVWNITQEEYDFHTDKYVNCLKKAFNENLAQKYIKEYLAKRATGYKEYDYYHPSNWAEMKKFQLNNRLNAVAYIVAFIKLHQQGYRIGTYEDWPFMLKCLANPEYHHISKVNNNIVVNFVKSSEYARYMCKKAGKQYPCDSLEIDYFKSGYTTIEGKTKIIDFSDLNNNSKPLRCFEGVMHDLPILVIQRAYRNYKKRPESLAKQIWEAVRNDGTPDRKKLLGITPRDTYPAPSWPTRDDKWIIEKKWQLSVRLANVTYGIVFKKLYQRGYIIIRGSDWSNQLKWLQNPDYYRIDKDNIEYIIRVTECEKYKANSWSIKSISTMHVGIKQCIGVFNRRWAQFDTNIYLLAFFLHLKYRDKGFTDSTFREHKPPYDMEYTDDYDTPEIWWSTCRQPDNFIQELGRISLFW
ncbi:unnamed protein product [Rhizophagus irregularis]|nr:unnamed protein product [Rhizophagus irregularis]